MWDFDNEMYSLKDLVKIQQALLVLNEYCLADDELLHAVEHSITERVEHE